MAAPAATTRSKTAKAAKAAPTYPTLSGYASLETTSIYTERSVEALRPVDETCHPAE